MAALSAARYVRSVMLLEKGQMLGGKTALSVNTIRASSTLNQCCFALTRFFEMTRSVPSHSLTMLGLK